LPIVLAKNGLHYIRKVSNNRRDGKKGKEAIIYEIYRFYLNGQFTISNFFSKELITH
jgi:hypothetical protein